MSYALPATGANGFYTLLAQESHWALRHEAMVSLLRYARAEPNDDLKGILPAKFCSPGQVLS
jgi:hypothetical protein